MNSKHQSFSYLNNPFFALLATQTHEALIILDAAQQIIFFNPAAEKLFGCGKNDALNLHFAVFCRRINFNLEINCG
ncbi:MAG: PAS domain-containing protein [Legionella longbeachae]|nr:PAS domain-containing protein [Legionella longbeachae]